LLCASRTCVSLSPSQCRGSTTVQNSTGNRNPKRRVRRAPLLPTVRRTARVSPRTKARQIALTTTALHARLLPRLGPPATTMLLAHPQLTQLQPGLRLQRPKCRPQSPTSSNHCYKECSPRSSTVATQVHECLIAPRSASPGYSTYCSHRSTPFHSSSPSTAVYSAASCTTTV